MQKKYQRLLFCNTSGKVCKNCGMFCRLIAKVSFGFFWVLKLFLFGFEMLGDYWTVVWKVGFDVAIAMTTYRLHIILHCKLQFILIYPHYNLLLLIPSFIIYGVSFFCSLHIYLGVFQVKYSKVLVMQFQIWYDRYIVLLLMMVQFFGVFWLSDVNHTIKNRVPQPLEGCWDSRIRGQKYYFMATVTKK